MGLPCFCAPTDVQLRAERADHAAAILFVLHTLRCPPQRLFPFVGSFKDCTLLQSIP